MIHFNALKFTTVKYWLDLKLNFQRKHVHLVMEKLTKISSKKMLVFHCQKEYSRLQRPR